MEDAIANSLSSAVTGGTLDLSGSAPPLGPSQVRYAALIFTGTLTGNQVVKVPNLTKWWWVNNQTAGAFNLQFQTPSGSLSSAINQNSGWQIVQCDGNNTITISPYNFNQVRMPDGTAALPSYAWAAESNSGWRRAGLEDYRFVIGGSDVLQVSGPTASTPSVFNVLSPLSLQQAGVQVIPPGTELPYAGVTLPAGFLWENGQAVSRTTYANLLAALRASFTGTTSNGNNTITSVGTDLRNLGLEGAVLEGNGVAGLTISSITSSTIVMSGNASASNTITIYAYPFGRGDGSTTFNVPDRRGRVIAGRDNMGNAGDAAAGRLTTGGSGVAGTQLTAAGGSQSISVTIAQANLPNVNFSISGIALNDPGHHHAPGSGGAFLTDAANSSGQSYNPGGTFGKAGNTADASTGITISSQGVAASGGSGTALTENVTQPTGIGNYIIKT